MLKKNRLPALIYLTGFMGSGKSTVGKLLSAELGYSFFDTDDRIVETAGKPVVDIFSDEGEPRFRALERNAVSESTHLSQAVVSLGGGALVNPENRKLVVSSGFLIYLQTSPETVWKRVRTSDERPLLRNGRGERIPDEEALTHIRRLLSAREDGYSSAHLTVTTDERSKDEIVRKIVSCLRT